MGTRSDGQMGVLATRKCKDGEYRTHRELEGVEAPIRNVLINTPSTLAIMLPISFKVAYWEQRGSGSLLPEQCIQ